VPAERCLQTSATLNHLHLQIVLPYCPPSHHLAEKKCMVAKKRHRISIRFSSGAYEGRYFTINTFLQQRQGVRSPKADAALILDAAIPAHSLVIFSSPVNNMSCERLIIHFALMPVEWGSKEARWQGESRSLSYSGRTIPGTTGNRRRHSVRCQRSRGNQEVSVINTGRCLSYNWLRVL